MADSGHFKTFDARECSRDKSRFLAKKINCKLWTKSTLMVQLLYRNIVLLWVR